MYKTSSIFLTLPKERLKVKSFEKWKEFLLMHLKTKVSDCQTLEVSVGVSDEDIQSFLYRLIVAKCGKMRKRRADKTRVIIYVMIDDFDLPLLIATEGKYILQAEQFYKMLFSKEIFQ